MKFELKTENENNSNSILQFLKIISILSLVIFLCDLSLKLGVISRHYQIEYNCRLLYLDKSNFKKLSRLSKIKSKQRIWEFCREVVK